MKNQHCAKRNATPTPRRKSRPNRAQKKSPIYVSPPPAVAIVASGILIGCALVTTAVNPFAAVVLLVAAWVVVAI
jgi:hypothetical protein